MTSDTDRLEREIQKTRSEVGGDVDALAEKIDPRRVAERRMEAVRETATNVKDRMMGVEEDVASAVSGAARMPIERTRGNPIAIGVIVFGIGWLAGSLLPMGDRERMATQRAMKAAEPLRSEAMQAAGELADGMREPLQQAAEQLTQSATESAQHLSETVTPS